MDEIIAFNWLGLAQIVFTNLVLSGDNALVIGMAAAHLPSRKKLSVIVIGMVIAAILRIVFAVSATYIIGIRGVLLLAGLLLAWACWRFWNEMKSAGMTSSQQSVKKAELKGSVWAALGTIAVADVSMSLDNIVAVAAIARDDTQLLIIGLILAIVTMIFFVPFVIRATTRYFWMSWLGLFFLVYLAITMLADGVIDLLS